MSAAQATFLFIDIVLNVQNQTMCHHENFGQGQKREGCVKSIPEGGVMFLVREGGIPSPCPPVVFLAYYFDFFYILQL